MRLTVAAFAVWIACGALRFARPAALEHDEARYALSARARLAGEHRWLYVPLGMDAVAAVPFALGACQ
ncbi:MAG TPA: hypothetical protein VLT45_12170 [Kofleriaceae bacterium]|nr:hypothetical protein [Kofleriaceae bacterium]